MIKENVWLLVCLCVSTLFGIYYITSQSEIRMLEQRVELGNKACEIADNQIRDLMYENQKVAQEKESSKTISYVAGAIDASVQRPDYYREIWHRGYDQGSEVKQELAESEEKQLEKEKKNTKLLKYLTEK